MMRALLTAAALIACSAHADWTHDAVEVPLYTRHIQHNEHFNNRTPGIVVQWDTPIGPRLHAGLFRNSNGDPTAYVGLHPEWRIRQEPVSDFVQWYRAGKHYCYMEQSTRANLRLTLDGETGKLKSAEVLP